MKQSGRAYLPKLNPMIPLPEFIHESRADNKFIAHCGADLDDSLGNTTLANLSWLVLIGPEGDFSPKEVALATDRQYTEISLGDAVYRTETAGIMVCQLINCQNQIKKKRPPGNRQSDF